MRKKEKPKYYVNVYEKFPIFKWKKCECCGEEVILEKMYVVTFYNDVYHTYQEPFTICKRCALRKIIGDHVYMPILNRAIPRMLSEYYKSSEEFEAFKRDSNRIK